ncbi:hypothetical protein A3218_02025 [Pseudomonas chlororaphis]|uniref:ArsR family transcriptional regulator n=1 Tax=Pseudomonas chlororaphis TaxID=587753 RepID=UPI000789E1DD|nr:ArsR family transcriptional regulator [Pseudomonas chlororaphis]AMS13149.1 hypothetical protein A3218_02025 [Pseudomonas chlororaphis]
MVNDVIEDVKKQMLNSIGQAIDSGMKAIESSQSKFNKAIFESLTMQQRDTACQAMAEQGMSTKQIEKVTGKSQPTVNRHLNGKHTI